jgi:hypothetical protein
VPIDPVAIQTPAGFVMADEVGALDGPALGATTPGRLELGTAPAVGFGPTTEGCPRWMKNAPPSAITATTVAVANADLNMDLVLHGPNTVR